MSELAETYDHTGKPVKHGRMRVNGIRMHYITAGKGPALLLLHGTPKNSFYWYRLFPLLTERFTLIAPDLRGFGYTDKPPSEDGYDSRMQAEDVISLMDQLGHDKFYLHGEDRGADYAYAVAGLYRDRVLKLSFCEMLASGLGLEESSFWTPENVTAQYRMDGVWCWVGHCAGVARMISNANRRPASKLLRHPPYPGDAHPRKGVRLLGNVHW